MSPTNNNTLWFPAPPVCTAGWSEEDWDNWRTKYGVMRNPKGAYEPEEMEFLGETWVATGRRTAEGETLYRRKT